MTNLAADVTAFVLSEMRYVYVAMQYLHARDGLDFTLLILNGVVGLRIFWHLAFPHIEQDEVVPLGANLVRWSLVGASAALSYRIFTGHYLTPFDASELPFNLCIWLMAELLRGDVRPVWDLLSERWKKRRDERRRIFGGKRNSRRA
ncbi:hypothetical protein [Paraburkholderia antibiotica]|uniref:Uncharacterized protein n=1 Tax=Paraburkholderia antibiotica TaxID=2728839 RepID=A0A7Y0FFX2_9BURK|nr:hypothetical protein [Paraburkholderia antibiotica]NML34504.1 hypothetical protein [Paraburkholderia antibiotica]